MGQHESSHAEHLEACGPTVWPSWHQTLAPRGPARPTGRGIFRGEFILLRSSPPGSRSRDMKGANGHLYAQRNRPCPISLPMGRHDYPSRLHQAGLDEEDLLGDGLERFLHHKAALEALRGHHNLRQGSRDPSLGDIREEDDEEFESVSAYEGQSAKPYKYPPIYSCPCGGQPDRRTIKQPLVYTDLHGNYSSLGRRTSKHGREIMKSSKITLPPVKEDQRERPGTPEEDYSSDESGISDHGMHSDHEDKGGYGMSSGDEAGSRHSKRPSCASSDSAMRDSDNMSTLSSDGECPHHGLDGHGEEDDFPRDDDVLADLDLVNCNPLNTSVLTEVTVHSDDCSSLFSSPRHDGEDTSHLSVSGDSASETYVTHSILSYRGNPPEPEKRSRSESPDKRSKAPSKPDVRSRSEKRPSAGKDDDYHMYSEISDTDQTTTPTPANNNVPQASPKVVTKATLSTSTPPQAPPPPPPPPAPPAPPPPPPAPPVPRTLPPTKSRQSSAASSPTSSSPTSPTTSSRSSPPQSPGTLADVLRQSITDGTFNKQNTLRRRKSISPTRNKVCHPVFDSSSLKRTDAHTNSLKRQYRETRQVSTSSASSTGPDTIDEKEELQNEEDGVNQKCANKIKALQNILIKQSLPFANPALMMGSSSRPASQDRLEDRKPRTAGVKESPTSPSTGNSSGSQSPGSGSAPSSPHPRSSGNTTPAVPQTKPQEMIQSVEEALSANYGRPSCYATISRLEKQENDSCFDQETRDRIASVKDKLQRAIPTSDHAATLSRS